MMVWWLTKWCLCLQKHQHPLRLRTLPTMVAPRRRRRRRRPPSKSFSTIVFRSQNRIYILQKTHEPPEKDKRFIYTSKIIFPCCHLENHVLLKNYTNTKRINSLVMSQRKVSCVDWMIDHHQDQQNRPQLEHQVAMHLHLSLANYIEQSNHTSTNALSVYSFISPK